MYKGDAQQTANMYNESFKAMRAQDRVAQASRDMSGLRSQILKLAIIQQAMWNILSDQGVTVDRLNSEIDEVLKKGYKFSYQDSAKPCPRCGKNVRESEQTPMSGRCMFCGTNVTFYPFDDNTIAPEDNPENTNNDPLADLDDLQ